MKRIMIADDNPVSSELVFEALAGDYAIVEAVDGLSAVRKFRAQPPDLALIDIQMPMLDGFGVLESIRDLARERHIPVVALTAFAMEGDREKALAAGFDAYITKPINLAGAPPPNPPAARGLAIHYLNFW